ncbi:hypothetical protein [Delftia acidovorans]|uniref:Uncharacterized protein n=1 Tax=Delftia acidovorans TaxID=80866 RepID=A0AAJ2RAD3_DELAC|nr:hypothetical protein [Delftia acidovorans]MDX4957922.1 hypothetical protein [Delftia acidovorans]
MQAHKVLEGLQKIRQSRRFDPSAIDLVEEKLVESQKFEFDFGDFPVLTEQEMSDQIRDLNLPYPLCYFSIPTVGGVLARDHEDCVLVQPFIKHGEQVGMLPQSMPLLLDKRDGSVCCKSEDPRVQSEWQNPKDDGIKVVVGLIALVVRGLAVLNCTNVHVVDNPPPESLNKKRLRSGKVPLFSYKTLHIKAAVRSVFGVGSSCERAGPRLHMRRGHIRRLSSGVSTWVQSCMVGNSKQGMVFKDYKVSA